MTAVRYRSKPGSWGFYCTCPAVDAFMKDLFEVYKKHNLAISHEDGREAFLINDYSPELEEWMNAAHIEANVACEEKENYLSNLYKREDHE